MTPATAVRGFLDALGVDPATIPVDLEAQVGLYRSLIADKRLLIVLDNARDTTQVTPLLPGNPSCTVLVTSRHQLTGLVTAHGARSLDLDVLPDTEAWELLARHLGEDRLAAEPHAVTELLDRCAGLPLAISIVVARATSHPDFPLAVLAEELRDHTGRLDALDTGDTNANLRAVLSWSYHALSPEAATVFELLGLAPGPDIGLPAAACLSALPTTRARTVLRDLDNAHLVGQHTPGRYRMHDLVRLYAADQAHHDHPETTRTAALRRLVDFYLHTAFAADRLLEPYRPPIRIGDPTAGCHPHPLNDETAAWAWFTAEHPNLLATQHLALERGWHTSVWHLAWTLTTFQWRQGHLHDALAMWRAALAAADQLGDPTTQTLAHRLLGYAYARVGLHADALRHLQQARTLAEHTGDLPSQAHTHRALAWAWEQQGDDRRVLEHVTHALHLYQALDMPMWEAWALNGVGWCQSRLGHHQQARTHCEAALALFRRHHDRDGEAATLDSLGYVAHHTSQHTQALYYYEQALTVYRDLGHTYYEADILDHLAEAHHTLGHHDQARTAWQQALELYQAQHRTTDTERIQQQLNSLNKDTS